MNYKSFTAKFNIHFHCNFLPLTDPTATYLLSHLLRITNTTPCTDTSINTDPTSSAFFSSIQSKKLISKENNFTTIQKHKLLYFLSMYVWKWSHHEAYRKLARSQCPHGISYSWVTEGVFFCLVYQFKTWPPYSFDTPLMKRWSPCPLPRSLGSDCPPNKI
jgi:hypothetical protein